jgi:hypothetical protein
MTDLLRDRHGEEREREEEREGERERPTEEEEREGEEEWLARPLAVSEYVERVLRKLDQVGLPLQSSMAYNFSALSAGRLDGGRRGVHAL